MGKGVLNDIDGIAATLDRIIVKNFIIFFNGSSFAHSY